MLYVFTTCALNFYPSARQLFSSLQTHLPEARRVLGLTDRVPDGFDPLEEGADEFIPVESLRVQIEHFDGWLFRHDIMELATAAKGFILYDLLHRPDCEAVIFLDPDCVVYSPLKPVMEAFERSSLLLTPHACIPHTKEEWYQFEFRPLEVGSFNLGFLGVRKDATGLTFARWWRERVRHFCVVDPDRFLFTDQKWIDLVPSYFDNVKILRHPTLDVARWNTFQRKVEKSISGKILIDGLPVDFIHFSGFYKRGEYVKGLYDRQSEPWCEDLNVLNELSDQYAAAIADDQARDICCAPWGYGHYDDGTTIDRNHRAFYRSKSSHSDLFPNPFQRTESNDFLKYYKDQEISRANKRASEFGDWMDRAQAAEGRLALIENSRSWKLIQAVRSMIAPFRF